MTTSANKNQGCMQNIIVKASNKAQEFSKYSLNPKKRSALERKIAIMKKAVAVDTRLTDLKKRYLLYIFKLCMSTGFAFPKDEHLAEVFGVVRETANRHLKDLEEVGYIFRDTKRKPHETYFTAKRKIYPRIDRLDYFSALASNPAKHTLEQDQTCKAYLELLEDNTEPQTAPSFDHGISQPPSQPMSPKTSQPMSHKNTINTYKETYNVTYLRDKSGQTLDSKTPFPNVSPFVSSNNNFKTENSIPSESTFKKTKPLGVHKPEAKCSSSASQKREIPKFQEKKHGNESLAQNIHRSEGEKKKANPQEVKTSAAAAVENSAQLVKIQRLVEVAKLPITKKDLTQWLKSYPEHKIEACIRDCANVKSLKNPPGWVQKALMKDYVGAKDDAEINRKYITDLNNKIHKFKLFKQHVELINTSKDFNLNIKHEMFKEHIETAIGALRDSQEDLQRYCKENIRYLKARAKENRRLTEILRVSDCGNFIIHCDTGDNIDMNMDQIDFIKFIDNLLEIHPQPSQLKIIDFRGLRTRI